MRATKNFKGRTLDDVETEDMLKELSTSVTNLKEAVALMKTDRDYQIKEVQGLIREMVTRFTEQIGAVTSSIRVLENILRGDGTTNGRKTVLDRLRELERDVADIRDDIMGVGKKLDQFIIADNTVKIEKIKGQWALWPVLIATALSSLTTLIVHFLRR